MDYSKNGGLRNGIGNLFFPGDSGMSISPSGPRLAHKDESHLSSDRAKLLHHNGALFQILVTSALTEEYRLYQKPGKPDPSM